MNFRYASLAIVLMIILCSCNLPLSFGQPSCSLPPEEYQRLMSSFNKTKAVQLAFNSVSSKDMFQDGNYSLDRMSYYPSFNPSDCNQVVPAILMLNFLNDESSIGIMKRVDITENSNSTEVLTAQKYSVITGCYLCYLKSFISEEEMKIIKQNINYLLTKKDFTYRDLPALYLYALGVDMSGTGCTHGLQLMKNVEWHLPACVKPNSVEKLIERGWGVMITGQDQGPIIRMMVVRWNPSNNTSHADISPVNNQNILKYSILYNALKKADMQYEAGDIPLCGSRENFPSYGGPPCLTYQMSDNLAYQMTSKIPLKFGLEPQLGFHETFVKVNDTTYRIILTHWQ